MKEKANYNLYRKSNFSNGFIALTILGLIVLGCTCNGEKFDFGTNKDSNSSQEKEKIDSPTEDKEISKSDASKGEMPQDDELQQLVKETILDFDKAIKTKDFTEFYNKSSEPFQDSISPRRMKNKFKDFIDGKADLSSVKNLEPEYTGTPKVIKIGRTDVLEVKGEFPTKPKPSRFNFQYIPDGKDWKIIKFEVYTTIYTKKR